MSSSPRILYLGNPSFGSLEWSFERAFRALGAHVDVFDITGERLLEALGPGTLPFRVGMRLARPFIGKILESSLAQRVRGRSYDLVWIHKNLLLAPRVIRTVADRVSARLFCYYPDHPFDPLPVRANALTRGLIPLVDCYFTFGHFIEEQLRSHGARRVEYLPFAYDPALHVRPVLDDRARARVHCEVAFVGNYSPERADWLKHLLHVDLGLWGHGWERARGVDPRFARAIRGGALIGRPFAEVYAAADVGLNLIQAYPDGHNMRSFEAPACGGMVLSNRTLELLQLFTEDEEIACFSTPAELQEKVAHYLRNPEARQRIATAGHARVSAQTYELRARRVLEVLAAQVG